MEQEMENVNNLEEKKQLKLRWSLIGGSIEKSLKLPIDLIGV